MLSQIYIHIVSFIIKETILLTPLLETVKKNSKLLNIKKEGS